MQTIENLSQIFIDLRKKCQQVFKMAANLEKLCFTFFACLPPYFGVSGSLTYANTIPAEATRGFEAWRLEELGLEIRSGR